MNQNNSLGLIAVLMRIHADGLENEFFEIGQLPYNMELDANKVDDVDYLIDYAVTYANGTNTDFEYQYDEDGNLLDSCSVSYTVEDM